MILPFLDGLRGHGQPATVITVFGNVHRGRALSQLKDIAVRGGLNVIAAASFSAEHSFSTDTYAVGEGRPDADDMSAAVRFGADVREKINSGRLTPIDLPTGRLSLMSRLLLFGGAKLFTKPPTVDLTRCTHCGICAKVCPSGAIDPDMLTIDKKKCVRCFACVKRCAFSARSIRFRLGIIGRVFKKLGAARKNIAIYL